MTIINLLVRQPQQGYNRHAIHEYSSAMATLPYRHKIVTNTQNQNAYRFEIKMYVEQLLLLQYEC